jgi:phage terminase small subunit
MQPAACALQGTLAASLIRTRERGMANGQLSAAVAAIKEKGILSGKRIERAEVGAPGEFDALTDDELERVARLGLTDVGETQH